MWELFLIFSSEVTTIKNKLASNLSYLFTQANRVKEEVNNSAHIKAIKQKVSSLILDTKISWKLIDSS